MYVKRDDYLNNIVLYFQKYLIENGINKSHIISIALDDLSNEKLRNPYNKEKY